VTSERTFVYLFFFAIGAYAIFSIIAPQRLISRESQFEPFLPYWMRELFVYDSEKKVRKACMLFLAISIAGIVTVSGHG
jgi:hypothetical protein